MTRKKSKSYTIQKSIFEKIDDAFYFSNVDLVNIRFTKDELLGIKDIVKIASLVFTTDKLNNICVKDKFRFIDEIDTVAKGKGKYIFDKFECDLISKYEKVS